MWSPFCCDLIGGWTDTEKGCNSPVFDLLSHSQERLFNVSCVFRRCLEEGNGQLIREFLNIDGGRS